MKHRRRQGISLLEVVAGVALLSLLAVSVTTTLRMATARPGAEDSAAEVDQLSRIARMAIEKAQRQADADGEESSSDLERASHLTTQFLDNVPTDAHSAAHWVIELEYAGHRYRWLVLETNHLGVSAYIGREKER